jgi:hypothetical protein
MIDLPSTGDILTSTCHSARFTTVSDLQYVDPY